MLSGEMRANRCCMVVFPARNTVFRSSLFRPFSRQRASIIRRICFCTVSESCFSPSACSMVYPMRDITSAPWLRCSFHSPLMPSFCPEERSKRLTAMLVVPRSTAAPNSPGALPAFPAASVPAAFHDRSSFPSSMIRRMPSAAGVLQAGTLRASPLVTTFTRHRPHFPFPPQGALTEKPSRCSTASRLSPSRKKAICSSRPLIIKNAGILSQPPVN